MNKKILFAFAASALLLAACGGTGESSTAETVSSETSSEPSSSQVVEESSSSSSSTEPEIVEVTKRFALTVAAGEGTKAEIEGASEDGTYEAGSTIKVAVSATSTRYAVLSVALDGASLAGVDGVYSFVMPNHEATLTTSAVVLGEAGLDVPTPVDRASVPTDATGIMNVLKAQPAIMATYFKAGTYEKTVNGKAAISYAIEAGHDDVLKVKGNTFDTEYGDYSNSYYEERGIQDGYYYDLVREGTTSNGSSRETLTTSKVVSGEEAAGGEILEASAKAKVTSYEFYDAILDEAFNETGYSGGFVNYDPWDNIVVSEPAYAAGDATYTISISAFEDSYDAVFHTFSMTVDGHGFVVAASLEDKTYDSNSFDEQGNLVAGAEPTNVTLISTSASSGYRPILGGKLDLASEAMSDYDVIVEARQPDGGSYDVSEGLQAGSILSFQFVARDQDSYLIAPRFVGAKEEGMLAADDYNVKLGTKTGPITLIFDNGLGVQKEVSCEVVPAKASSLRTSLSADRIFVGETLTLGVEITPAAAPQGAEVTVDESSTGSVSIVDNGDGTFTITGVSAGNVVLNVVSKDNPDVTGTCSFAVAERPNYDKVYETITTKTLGYDGGYYGAMYVNFEADGTGSYIYREDSYSSYYLVTFNWTLDESTMAFAFSDQTTDEYWAYLIETFSIVSNTEFTAEMDSEFGSSTMNLAAMDRFDITTYLPEY